MVCVSFRAYGLRWSIMAYDVRLSTETEVSLQKCNYIQIMVFPVVVIDKTDAGKKWLVEHWMIYTRDRHKNEASRSQLSVSSAVLSCTFLSSQHWLPSNTPWSTIPQSSAPTARWSPRPLQWLPTFLPPWIPLSLCSSSLHKPKGPFRGLLFPLCA